MKSMKDLIGSIEESMASRDERRLASASIPMNNGRTRAAAAAIFNRGARGLLSSGTTIAPDFEGNSLSINPLTSIAEDI